MYGEQDITIPMPRLISRCSGTEWELVPIGGFSSPLVWQMPRGDASHTSLVTALTALAGLLAAAAVVLTAAYHTTT